MSTKKKAIIGIAAIVTVIIIGIIVCVICHTKSSAVNDSVVEVPVWYDELEQELEESESAKADEVEVIEETETDLEEVEEDVNDSGDIDETVHINNNADYGVIKIVAEVAEEYGDAHGSSYVYNGSVHKFMFNKTDEIIQGMLDAVGSNEYNVIFEKEHEDYKEYCLECGDTYWWLTEYDADDFGPAEVNVTKDIEVAGYEGICNEIKLIYGVSIDGSELDEEWDVKASISDDISHHTYSLKVLASKYGSGSVTYFYEGTQYCYMYEDTSRVLQEMFNELGTSEYDIIYK